MINFLIHKPVSVLMTFLAIVMLAIFSIRKISIILLPDIDIPTISVIVHHPDHSAMEVEQSVMAPLRQSIKQVVGVERLESKASDEQGRLTVHFPYGKDIDLAFFEVNEKLDLAINALPDGMDRPIVVKTKASDLPVVYLTIWYKDSLQTGSQMDLSEFASKTVRRRLEKLPSMAMADLTGGLSSHISLMPKENMLQSLGIGMMIDNGIIVLDNIVQESVSGATSEETCIRPFMEAIHHLDLQDYDLEVIIVNDGIRI